MHATKLVSMTTLVALLLFLVKLMIFFFVFFSALNFQKISQDILNPPFSNVMDGKSFPIC